MIGGAIKAARFRRIDMALRIAAAVPLNYALTSLVTVLLARLLPGGPAQSALGATLLSFLLFALVAMAAFAVRSGWRFALGLIAAGAAVGALDWWLLVQAGRL
jgi:hypothetical protein